jgi:hypothetical protein
VSIPDKAAYCPACGKWDYKEEQTGGCCNDECEKKWEDELEQAAYARGRAEERESIVAWLKAAHSTRAEERAYPLDEYAFFQLGRLGDLISRGEHVQDGGGK